MQTAERRSEEKRIKEDEERRTGEGEWMNRRSLGERRGGAERRREKEGKGKSEERRRGRDERTTERR